MKKNPLGFPGILLIPADFRWIPLYLAHLLLGSGIPIRGPYHVDDRGRMAPNPRFPGRGPHHVDDRGRGPGLGSQGEP